MSVVEIFNISFIGMPGCGKSTLGNAISKELNLSFVDTDLLIEKKFEMTLEDVKNKFGYQLGYKIFNTFSVDKLTLQTNNKIDRPYTYSHSNTYQNYAHYNQPLAHPLGANFSEYLFLINYKWKKFIGCRS